MVPFKKILSPTDFSDLSYEAMKAANELALHFSAELYVVHVVPPIPTANVPAPKTPSRLHVPSYRQELEESSKKSLDEIVKQQISKEVRAHPIVVEGDASYQIVRIAEEENVDLIVMATHGETGWRRLVIGSVAEKVGRLARCAVLTIHPLLMKRSKAR
jgi:nucleotide-binding universal stress UspA family protein